MKVVVFGSDRYLSTIFPLFDRFYRQYWPDNPWPTEVVGQTFVVDGYPTALTGPDETFSQQVLRYVRAPVWHDDPFLMLLDDYFLCAPVKTKVVMHAYDVMMNDPDVVHVNLWVVGDDVWKRRYDEYLGEFEKSECNWLFQNQAGIWRPRLLRDLAREEENGWQMETRGSKRARSYPGKFLTVYENAIEYHNYMARDKPRREALEWLEAQGIDPIYP